jgi:enoyl-[acyl-carrier protein] reductase I
MAELMKGKRGLVMGVANDRSIAWGIASALAAEGAELAFSFQGEAFGKRVQPLAASVGSDFLIDVDVTNEDSLDACFGEVGRRWGSLDFVIHAIAFSDKTELTGRFINTTKGNFLNSLNISCFSFIDVARRAEPLMTGGGTLITLTFQGSNKVVPNYNVMGVAKAALEASVRYLAADYGPQGIRVNALSPGPVRTLAGAGISDARAMYSFMQAHSPLRKSVTLEEIGGSALYFLSELSGGVTGEVHHIDAGYNIISMPRPDRMKAGDAGEG